MRSLFDVSWQVDEPTYRNDPALSYSTIAKFDRGGVASIATLNDSIQTDSLLFGSLVDTLITGSSEEFNALYTVEYVPGLTPTKKRIIESIYETYKLLYSEYSYIPKDSIIEVLDAQDFQKNWKTKTRLNAIETCAAQYYSFLRNANNKTVVPADVMQEVALTVNTLLSSPATAPYFNDSDLPEYIEHLYQLKFKGSENGINYRIMADEIVVDHAAKTIQPIDLKTSSHAEVDFYQSFIQWRYHMQARLYAEIIRQNIVKDDYFKDFTILPYKFAVVNKKTRNPLMWTFKPTFTRGTIYVGASKQIALRDPFEVGEILYNYLSEKTPIPYFIAENFDNDLMAALNTL